MRLLAAAIVVAGALVGVGLYAGLSARPAPAASLPSPPSVTPAGSPGATASPPEVDPAKLRAAAARALDDFRRRTMTSCWRPAIARTATPSRSTYRVNLTFGADGTEIARGVSEVRDVPSRPDVAACLGQQPLGLRIPAPGARFQIELPLQYPE